MALGLAFHCRINLFRWCWWSVVGGGGQQQQSASSSIVYINEMKWATTTTTAATKENRLFHDIIISPISNFIYTACESTTTLSLSLSISPTCTYTFGFSDWLFDNWAPHTPATWCLAEWLGGPILPPAEVAVSRLTKEILVPKCRAPICVGHFFFLSHSHAIGTKAYHNFWQRARRLPISNSQDIDSSFIKVSVFAYVRTLKEKTKDTSEQKEKMVVSHWLKW